MFLSHFSSTSIPELMEMLLIDLADWYHEALNLHNYLTPSSNE